ncbi:ATP-binding protein [Bacillus daqingensis]|uniref:ATP-binding protein n=1 Tax=Bacillus daqingensis TaxID=872396 RepID=A0ABV9P136_9BACI
MKLTRIYIRSYYKWKDQFWELENRTIFTGKNEAGKTTIMAFIEGVLFGFSDQEMTGAGGSLLFEESGTSWLIEREQKRTIRGERSIYCNGEPYHGELLTDISLPIFRSLYRLDLDHLQDMQKRDSQEVGSLLYDTSFSGLKRLIEEDKRRSKDRTKLFKPRGRKTELNETAAKLDQLQQQIKQAEQELDRYEQLKEEDALLEEEQKTITSKRQTGEAKRREAEILAKLQPIKVNWLNWKAKAADSGLLSVTTAAAYREKEELQADLYEKKRTLLNTMKQPAAFEEEAELARLRTLVRAFPERRVLDNQLEEAGASLAQLQQEQQTLEQENPAAIPLRQLPAADVLAERTAELGGRLPSLTWWLPTTILLMLAAAGFLAAEYVTAVLALIGGVISAAVSLYLKNKPQEAPGDAYYELSTAERETLLSLKQRYDKAADKTASYEREYRISAGKLDALMEGAASYAGNASSPSEMEGILQVKLERLERSSLASEEEQRRFRSQQTELNAIETRLSSLERELAELRRQADEEDRTAFDQLLRRFEAGREAELEAENCFNRMLDLVPDRKVLLRLLELPYEAAALDELEESLQELEAKAVQTERKSAETKLLIKQLEEEGTYEVLTQQYYELQESLASSARRWAVLEAAGAAVQKLTDTYEKEKLPAVMKRTSDLFNRMTKGRYVSISMPGEGSFAAESHTGKLFNPDQLSRGTRELLYTALRLSLTAERERFPLIMDEPVVNMDKDRRTAFFKEASAHPSQLIFFTCHGQIEEEWLQAAGGKRHLLER